MKTFKFRLQTVLEQRERRETAAKQSFAEAQGAWERACRLLDEMRDIRQALLDELCRRRTGAFEAGTIDAFETRLYQDYMQVITQTIAEQETYVRELGSTCAAQKLHLLGTAQDRQALTGVRDRHKQAHSASVLRAEQGIMDELATARFNFGRRAAEG